MTRVVIFTSPHHLYGNYLVKALLQQSDACRVVGIVESTVVLPRRKTLDAMWKILRRSGVFFLLAQGIKAAYFRIGCALSHACQSQNTDSVFFYYERLANQQGIPIHQTHDVNSLEASSFVRNRNPDLIVILLFAQILKESIIKIPRRGCLNFHPSLLPKNRGLMPIFWALADDERESGATIHSVDTGIDTGPVLAQEATRIRSDDTEHSLYARVCVIGARLILAAIKNPAGSAEMVLTDRPYREPSYHSIPTRDAVQAFRRRGRKFFSIGNLRRPFESF